MSGQTFFRPGLDKPVDSLVMSKTCGGSYDEWANLFKACHGQTCRGSSESGQTFEGSVW